MASKKSVLRRHSYFPIRGDVLEEFGTGIGWTLERYHKWYCPQTKQLVRYGLLVARIPDMFGDAPVPRVICDGDDKSWLDGIQVIRRAVYEHNTIVGFKTFAFNKDLDLWSRVD
jgi:hypothetical protein